MTLGWVTLGMNPQRGKTKKAETLSGSMIHYCDEERSTINEGTFPRHQEDTTVIGKRDSNVCTVIPSAGEPRLGVSHALIR